MNKGAEQRVIVSATTDTQRNPTWPTFQNSS